MEVLTFEEFAARHRAGREHMDAGLHAKGQSTDTAHARHLDRESTRLRDHDETRAQLRRLYNRLVQRGVMRPPTRLERLERIAAGNPDKPSVRAAMRLLEKKRNKGIKGVDH